MKEVLIIAVIAVFALVISKMIFRKKNPGLNDQDVNGGGSQDQGDGKPDDPHTY